VAQATFTLVEGQEYPAGHCEQYLCNPPEYCSVEEPEHATGS